MIPNNLVRHYRTERDVTILELARLTRISPSDLSQIELGKKVCFPSWRKRIADVLKIDERVLFPEFSSKARRA